MPIFGIDISHHQGAFDVERAAREGIEFFILKATEGSGFTDSRFKENLAKVRKTGKLVAAYHYQRAGISAAAQVAHIRRVVPKDVPVILDVEANSGHVSLTRDIIARLRKVGYRSPLLYLPRWYWRQIGSPSLAGLPPLWSSRYPDNRVGDIEDEYADVPAHFWNGYGGLPVVVLQFTSSARVAGRAPIDGNAFRGTAAELHALFGGRAGGGSAAPAQRTPATEDEETVMELKPGTDVYVARRIPKGKKRVTISIPVGEMRDVRIRWGGPKYPGKKASFPPGDNYPTADWVTDDYTNKAVHRMRDAVIDIPQKGKGVEDTPVTLQLSYTWQTDANAVGSLDFE